MHSRERQKLVESYSDEHGVPHQAQIPEHKAQKHSNEPGVRVGLVLKCAVCVAVVVLLVVIGSGEDKPGTTKEARGNAVPPPAFTQSSSAAADRKDVFDARRARFEGSDAIPGKRYAAAVTPTDPLKSRGIADPTCSGGVDGGMDANGNECGKESMAATR